MKLTIFAIGRMKSGPDRDLLERYTGRANNTGKSLQLDGPGIREFSESRAKTSEKRKQDEAAIMLAEIPRGAYLIALDEYGQDISSNKLANLLTSKADEACPNIVFAIGGPDGHGQQILDNAQRKIRFGSMTWPHQMVRIMLAEQIYRSMTILTGHPYHRG